MRIRHLICLMKSLMNLEILMNLLLPQGKSSVKYYLQSVCGEQPCQPRFPSLIPNGINIRWHKPTIFEQHLSVLQPEQNHLCHQSNHLQSLCEQSQSQLFNRPGDPGPARALLLPAEPRILRILKGQRPDWFLRTEAGQYRGLHLYQVVRALRNKVFQHWCY